MILSQQKALFFHQLFCSQPHSWKAEMTTVLKLELGNTGRRRHCTALIPDTHQVNYILIQGKGRN